MLNEVRRRRGKIGSVCVIVKREEERE